mmetsp:Transcript_37784/g.62652  ORF Transcript_37784/g.62652 Transcript_37784/m.62652 type:complete len:151 (-) Transcript_37784:95-547(-)
MTSRMSAHKKKRQTYSTLTDAEYTGTVSKVNAEKEKCVVILRDVVGFQKPCRASPFLGSGLPMKPVDQSLSEFMYRWNAVDVVGTGVLDMEVVEEKFIEEENVEEEKVVEEEDVCTDIGVGRKRRAVAGVAVVAQVQRKSLRTRTQKNFD